MLGADGEHVVEDAVDQAATGRDVGGDLDQGGGDDSAAERTADRLMPAAAPGAGSAIAPAVVGAPPRCPARSRPDPIAQPGTACMRT